jgi:hypothetical protein
MLRFYQIYTLKQNSAVISVSSTVIDIVLVLILNLNMVINGKGLQIYFDNLLT